MWMLFGQNYTIYIASGLTKAPAPTKAIVSTAQEYVSHFLSPVPDKISLSLRSSGGTGLRDGGNRCPLHWTPRGEVHLFAQCTLYIF